MKNRYLRTAQLFLAFAAVAISLSCRAADYDVVIIGGGVSGTAAGIRSAQTGARTLLLEEGPWLGGMLTAAGVSATDGNYRLRGGLWGQFRDSLEARYGGAEALKTGWVSNIQFEPHAGAEIFAAIAAREKLLTVKLGTAVRQVIRRRDRWKITTANETIRAKVLIDATELGDIAAAVGVKYDIGMDSRTVTGEEIAPEEANGIVQDLTMAMIVKDYGYDRSIEQPAEYTPDEFACCCINARCIEPKEAHRMWSAEKMLTYGRLPNGKYMINWPIEGNDYYVDMISLSAADRAAATDRAKARSIRFLYFMQHELGLRTFDLADDEFPTKDRLPLMPYHRESRRIDGIVRFTLNHITAPYDYTLYRTAIGVGDYPVDQHHTRYSGWEQLPDLYFHSIPSYGVPLGILFPKNHRGLIVAEKSVSVTNLVNGSTRLQPVVLQIGEAAGITAALAVLNQTEPSQVPVREVQRRILATRGYLLPFLDLPSEHPHFAAMQRIGATGIIRGEGLTVGWENQTWFHAHETISATELCAGLQAAYPSLPSCSDNTPVTARTLEELLKACSGKDISTQKLWAETGLTDYDCERPLTRLECAVAIDAALSPFDSLEIDLHGNFIR